MNKQELFDKVATHLLTQNAKSLDDDSCQYRNPEGLACAVGCLIPEDEYTPQIERLSVAELYGYHNDILGEYQERRLMLAILLSAAGVKEGHLELLRELQIIHDCCDMSIWKSELKHIAACHRLSAKALKSF